jgi:hypothetical protein
MGAALDEDGGMTRGTIGRATYLYCLVHRPTAPSLAKAPAGLPGMGAPRAVALGPSLWLVVADAPLDRYAGPAIDRRLHDLDWVSACALAHEAVVEHAATLGTAVPMKLFTLFTTEARALGHIRRRRRALAGVIRRIAGRQEWGVRIRTGAAPARPGRHAHVPRAVSGTQFLMRKQREADARRRRATPAAPPVRQALGALGRISDGARRRAIPPEASRVSGLVADAVFLVATRESPRFLEAVDRTTRSLAGQGFDLTLTGPWPPYHFIPGRR